MKKIFIVCFLSFSTFAQANIVTTKDSIFNFSLSYTSKGWTGIDETITIDPKGNIIATITYNNGSVVAAKKMIKLDANTFRQFKIKIIQEAQIFTIPETVNCTTCHDGHLIEISINCSLGKKKISGQNPESANENVKFLMHSLDDLVGFIGLPDYGK